MFVIEMRHVLESTIGKWFRIWESEDGADTARYLRDNEMVERDPNHGRHRAGSTKYTEYRMLWVPKETK